MYLPILLIIITAIVFYTELDWKRMNRGEIVLMSVVFMTIIIAAVNYMKLTDNDGKITEGFSSSDGGSHKKRDADKVNERIGVGSPYGDDLISVMNQEVKAQAAEHEAEIDLVSPVKGDYLDPDIEAKKVQEDRAAAQYIAPFSNIDNNSNGNKDSRKVAAVDGLLKNTTLKLKPLEAKKEKFNELQNEENIRSMFAPQIVVGEKPITPQTTNPQTGGLNSTMSWGNEVSNWDFVYKHAGDGMTFNNTMSPVSDLWKNADSVFDVQNNDQGNNWTQGLSAYAKGQWNADLYLKPSDWATLPQGAPTSGGNPPTVGTATTVANTVKSNFDNTPVITQSTSKVPKTTVGQQNKLCGTYDDLNLATDKSGNILIGNYTKAKKYFPGYTYIPPIYWDVPQRHTPVCAQPDLNVRKLTGLMDRGTPVNALELNPDGSIASTEDTVSLTNVGSMMPKFNYYEVPFSQPYV